MIVDNVKKINKKNILEARKLRAERLSKLAHEAAVLETGQKQKADQFEIKFTKIPATDVVFRVMTWDHIPLDDVKTNTARTTWKPTKIVKAMLTATLGIMLLPTSIYAEPAIPLREI